MPHTTGDAVTDQGVDDALGIDDLIGPRNPALELLVGAERVDLILAPSQQGETREIASVGPQQDDLEVLDLAVTLEPSQYSTLSLNTWTARFSRPRTACPHPMNSPASAMTHSFLSDPPVVRQYSTPGAAAMA